MSIFHSLSQALFSAPLPISSIPPEILGRYTPKRDFDEYTQFTPLPDLPASVDLVILTITEAEFLAVFERMEPLPSKSKVSKILLGNSFYILGTYGHYTAVLLATYQPGTGSAMNYLNSAITQFKCQLVVNIGIAWGANPQKQKLGDVLVADRVVNVDDVKISQGREIQRGPVPPIHPRSNVIVRATHLSWRDKYTNVDDRPCKMHCGLYVGSNTLLNDAGRKREILEKHPEAIGGEMESFAVYEAASFHGVPWMVIKGISDWGDGTKHDEYHPVATWSAVSFLYTMCSGIRDLIPESVERRNQEDEKKKDGR